MQQLAVNNGLSQYDWMIEMKKPKPNQCHIVQFACRAEKFPNMTWSKKKDNIRLHPTPPKNDWAKFSWLQKASENDQEIAQSHVALQTNPWHREEEPQITNSHKTPGGQPKLSNQLSLPH